MFLLAGRDTMPRAIATKQYKDFTGGLDTDTSYLNMKENTVKDIDGFVIDKSGKLYRSRYGYETEDYYTTTDSTAPGYPINTFVWENAAGQDVDILVVRNKTHLYFFDTDKYAAVPTNLIDNFIAEKTLLPVDLSGFNGSDMQFASGGGKLYVVCRGLVPLVISWDGATTFSSSYDSLVVRDFSGVDDGLSPIEKPLYTGDQFFWLDASATGTFTVGETVTGSTTGVAAGTVVSWDATYKIVRVTTNSLWELGETITGDTSSANGWLVVYTPVMSDYPSNNHLYNLVNQGWSPEKITYYTVDRGNEPSSSSSWFLGKDVNDDFSPSLLDKQGFGTGFASRGSHTFSPIVRDRENTTSWGYNGEYRNIYTVGGTATVDTQTEDVYPTTIAFSFSRVWYSINRSEYNSNKIWFSQVLDDSSSNFTHCYQAQDPTSEDFNSILDTDGGELSIDGAGSILKLLPFRSGMLVFGTNGVWFIGSPDTGFTSTSFSVSKVTDYGVLGARSIVSAKDTVFYLGSAGVIAIGLDPSGGISATNVSEGKIATYYQETLSTAKKRNSTGIYDIKNNRILWTHSIFDTRADEALVLNLDLGCFYKLTLPSFSYAPFYRPNAGIRLLQRDFGPTNFTFNFYKLEGDLFTSSSYMETFYETLGDSVRDKNIMYLVFQFERTEEGFELDGSDIVFDNPSSCLMTSKWEWTDHTSANRWSSPQQVYRLPVKYIPSGVSDPFNYGYRVITTKNRVRGNGRAITFKIYSDGDNDIKLLGWTAVYTGAGIV